MNSDIADPAATLPAGLEAAPPAPQPVIYEVSLKVQKRLAGRFDAWLKGHVDTMLGLPGFIDAEIEPREAGHRHVLRVVRYRLVDRQALDDYFAQHASEMRADGVARFGNRFSAERRILEGPAATAMLCANCGHALGGRYCSACGQDSHSNVMSLTELIGDFAGDILSLDSRFLRSVRPLLWRPGFLTNEYLDGRRSRYIPPLRLYLFISVVFFFLLSIALVGTTWFDFDSAAASAPGGQLHFRIDKPELANKPPWVRRLAEQAMAYNERPQAFFSAAISRLPTAMFILLPVFALFLKILYVRRRRYYVEHLIFSFHYHAVVFLAAILYLASYGLAEHFGLTSITNNLAGFLWLYLTIYLIVAMRNVYRQGWFKTLTKWSVLACFYGVAMCIALAIALTSTLLA
jgi:hypothetical protein